MRRLLGYLAIPLLLIGCGIGEAFSGDEWVDLTPAILVGPWSSSRGDTIEFTADGEFFGDNVKYMFAGTGLASGVDFSQDKVGGSGQWRLTTPLGHPGGRRALVGLGFDVVGGQPAATSIDKLEGRRKDDRIELVYYLGDPDLNDVVIYRRCENGCPSVVPDRPLLGVPTAAGLERLIGTWVDQHGAQLVLETHGGFTAQDLRFAYAAAAILLPPGVDPEAGPVSALGSWTVKPPQHDPSGPATTVVLTIVKLAGKRTAGIRPLRIYANGQDLLLASVSSNPEVIEQRVFHRA